MKSRANALGSPALPNQPQSEVIGDMQMYSADAQTVDCRLGTKRRLRIRTHFFFCFVLFFFFSSKKYDLSDNLLSVTHSLNLVPRLSDNLPTFFGRKTLVATGCLILCYLRSRYLGEKSELSNSLVIFERPLFSNNVRLDALSSL